MAEQPLEPDGEAIFPDNWPIVQAFCTLSTQWRFAPSGRMIGLDYAAVRPTLALMRVPRADWPEVFEGLRVMEDAALAELDKRHG